jgi:crotonobetainyl-CoA:carnitine CoA-transferase CaiB-like acyl-CoA transferase
MAQVASNPDRHWYIFCKKQMTGAQVTDSMPTKPSIGALTGIRVLDMSRILAGPWATQLLGDLGADVLKIEKPGVGDDTRAWGPPFISDEPNSDAAYFTCANRNKSSVTIDFTKPEGAQILSKLIPQHHVFVENFKTGGLAKYGLDYTSVAKINPAIVYCSITGFGQDGPCAQRAGYDYLVQAAGGLMSVTGQPDGTPGGEPLKVGVAVADLFTGMYATVAILAALRHAEATGVGQHLDLSLLDCQTAMLANQGANYLVSGVAPGRLGNAHPNIAPYQVFATADGHVVLAVGNDSQFRAFCEVADLLDMKSDARFTTNALRVANRVALIAQLGPAMETRTTDEWMTALEAAHVPCGPINTIDKVFADPQVVARGMQHDMARSDGTILPLVANPIKMSVTPPLPRHAPPSLGADTDSRLAELAGLNSADLSDLHAKGII